MGGQSSSGGNDPRPRASLIWPSRDNSRPGGSAGTGRKAAKDASSLDTFNRQRISDFRARRRFAGDRSRRLADVRVGKPGPLTEDKVVNIVREDDGGSIAEQLERAGVIDNATWFSLLTVFDGTRAALKRGEYEFKAGDSLRQVETRVISGKVVSHRSRSPRD